MNFVPVSSKVSNIRQVFRRRMCILFMYNGSRDEASDYSLIVASNRDEYYKRPSQNMGPWSEDPNVFGGRDLEVNGGGSWLAFSPSQSKLGVLLNLPRDPKPNAKTRGSVVTDYMKSETSVKKYVDDKLKSYVQECNDFIFIAVELDKLSPSIHTYSNATDELITHTDSCLGFGNSLPEIPLKKVEAGKRKLRDICSTYNKAFMKQDLIKELIGLLKSEERHLPDYELEKRRPGLYQQLSSIFVSIPDGGYGTRTHTLILVTKTGHTDVIEISMQPPIDVQNPIWKTTEFQFNIKSNL